MSFLDVVITSCSWECEMISGCIWNSGFIMSEDLLPGGEIKTLSWQNNNECDH